MNCEIFKVGKKSILITSEELEQEEDDLVLLRGIVQEFRICMRQLCTKMRQPIVTKRVGTIAYKILSVNIIQLFTGSYLR